MEERISGKDEERRVAGMASKVDAIWDTKPVELTYTSGVMCSRLSTLNMIRRAPAFITAD